MIGYFHITPKSQTALKIVNIHGSIMGVDKQKNMEVLLWCATPTCECWKDGNRRYRNWFRLHQDVELGSSVPLADLSQDLNGATPI